MSLEAPLGCDGFSGFVFKDPDSFEEYRSGALFHVLFKTNLLLFPDTRHMLKDKDRAIKNVQVIPALLELSSD